MFSFALCIYICPRTFFICIMWQRFSPHCFHFRNKIDECVRVDCEFPCTRCTRCILGWINTADKKELHKKCKTFYVGTLLERTYNCHIACKMEILSKLFLVIIRSICFSWSQLYCWLTTCWTRTGRIYSNCICIFRASDLVTSWTNIYELGLGNTFILLMSKMAQITRSHFQVPPRSPHPL